MCETELIQRLIKYPTSYMKKYGHVASAETIIYLFSILALQINRPGIGDNSRTTQLIFTKITLAQLQMYAPRYFFILMLQEEQL